MRRSGSDWKAPARTGDDANSGETSLPFQEHDCLPSNSAHHRKEKKAVQRARGKGHLGYQEPINVMANSPGTLGAGLGAVIIINPIIYSRPLPHLH